METTIANVTSLADEEIEDLLLGAGLLGSGGGGGERYARYLLGELASRGMPIRLVQLADLADDEIVFRPFFLGARFDFDQIQAFVAEGAEDPKPYELSIVRAAELLRDHLRARPVAYLPPEIGPANTTAAMYVAARSGVPTLDADSAGRAIPEMCLDLLSVRGLPVAPFALASEFGERAIFHHVRDAVRMEQVGRALARCSGGVVAVVQAFRAGDIRDAVVPGSIRRAIDLGRHVRKSRIAKRPPVEDLVSSGLAVTLFEGVMSGSQRTMDDAFVVGEHFVERRNSRCRVWYKNENLVMWKDDEPFATCPDVIAMVDAHTGQPLFNDQNDHYEGREVVVLGIPADEMWRSEMGSLMTPRYFGFPFDSISVEKRRRVVSPRSGAREGLASTSAGR